MRRFDDLRITMGDYIDHFMLKFELCAILVHALLARVYPIRSVCYSTSRGILLVADSDEEVRSLWGAMVHHIGQFMLNLEPCFIACLLTAISPVGSLLGPIVIRWHREKFARNYEAA